MNSKIKELKKKGVCPDCNKKGNKCTCNFKELYLTIKIKDLEAVLSGGEE